MEDRNSLFTKDELSTFFNEERNLVYDAKQKGKTPNTLYDFWREKKKLFDHRVFERGLPVSGAKK